MKDPSPVSSPELSDQPPEIPLDSWKEIATYVKRDVSTVQRWEKREGMPVHRHVHDKRGSVYAFGSELDAWLQSRRLRLEEEEKERLAETPVNAEGDHEPKGPPRARRWLVLGGVALLALITVAYVMIRSRAGGATRAKIMSLAVLPLKNLSGDPTQEYLADGMTEELIGRLAAIHDLRVISRTSAMHFKDTQLSVPEIAKTLRVDAIVEGSVMRAGDQIRVHAQLIRGATDEHFWSETYDRNLRDVLALESDVAQSIARKVEVTVTGKENERLTKVRSTSPEVYESYLKGRFANDKADSRAEIEQAIDNFDEAINRDPTFAPAYVGLADAYFGLSTIFIGVPSEQVRPKAMSAVRKALELDPESAEAHVLLARLEQVQWQWSEAETEYKRALELSPNNAAAHAELAMWLLSQGHTEEALVWTRRGRELDPLAVSGYGTAWILTSARRALIANGQPEQAIPVLEKGLSVSHRNQTIVCILIRAYAHAGRRTDALRLLAELNRRKQTGYVPAAAFVNAYLGLDDYDQAFAWLDQAYKEHSNLLLWLKVYPYFDAIRGDPRFVDLVRRVGLDQAR